jgi:hypothetical protein
MLTYLKKLNQRLQLLMNLGNICLVVLCSKSACYVNSMFYNIQQNILYIIKINSILISLIYIILIIYTNILRLFAAPQNILPSFQNIRCFRFVKQMYLDTF